MCQTAVQPVTVTATNLSRIDGLTHISISIENLDGLVAATELRDRLSAQPALSSVGGVYNRVARECHLYTFVQANTHRAAVEHVTRLLGTIKQ